MTDTIVVGLDGAGFELLGPLVEEGELPALAEIFERGVIGDLESVLPPVTSPNWKAYLTGKNPAKLGIFWWHNVDVENRRVHRPVERYQDHTEYWEVLAEAGERVGVLGVPTTYPPKPAGEFVVSGPPDAEESGYTHPPSLEAELKERFDYRVNKRGLIDLDDPPSCEEVLDIIDTRFEAATHLFDERSLSFMQVTTFYINALHHNLWDHEYTIRGWKIIDDHLASLLERDCNLVLMSDHGHAEIETVFNINAWLEREGYLTYDRELSDRLHSMGVNTDRIKRLLVRIDRTLPGMEVRSAVERAAPRWLINRLPDESGELGGSKHEMADWDETDAIASAQGPVYITVDRESARYELVREALVDALSTLTGPDGRPIATAVHRAEEVYEGPYLAEAPDIVIDKAPHVNIREGFGAAEVFPETDPSWRGVNTRSGLFAAVGPDFRAGTVEGMSILDLAPTLLHLHGQPVPDDMDGRVRRSVFAEDSPPANETVRELEADD